MTFTVVHASGNMFARETIRLGMLRVAVTRGDSVSMTEGSGAADRAAARAMPGFKAYVANENPILTREATLRQVAAGQQRLLMVGGRLGTGAKGDHRRRGPWRYANALPNVREKATGKSHIRVSVHLIAKPQTTQRWRLPLWTASVVKLRGFLADLERANPGLPVIVTGDFNYDPRRKGARPINLGPGYTQIRLTPTFGRTAYDHLFVKGDIRVSNVRTFRTGSDHLGFAADITHGAKNQPTPAPAPKPAPKPTPKPPTPAPATPAPPKENTPMGLVDTVIATARSQVGVHEGRSGGHWNNLVKYAGEVPGLAWANGQPWCATFVSWVALKAGAADLYPRTASCDVAGKWFKDRDRWSEYPAIGAQVFFGKPSDLSHTGIVIAYDDDSITTIEGNTNNTGSREGDGVYLMHHQRRSSRVIGYGYPAFAEGITSSDPAWARQTPAKAPAKTTPAAAPKVTNHVTAGRAKIRAGLALIDEGHAEIAKAPKTRTVVHERLALMRDQIAAYRDTFKKGPTP